MFVPPSDAVIVTVVFALTGLVAALKVVLYEPAATITLAGTASAAGLLLLNVTTAPSAGADPFNSTATVTVPPPTSEYGMEKIPPSSGTSPNVFVAVIPPEAETTKKSFVVSATVAILKFALVAPSGTVTLAGTLAVFGLLLFRFTSVPPAGAGLAKTTVPAAAPGPTGN